jgi:hypothetical protein
VGVFSYSQEDGTFAESLGDPIPRGGKGEKKGACLRGSE